MKSTSVLSPVDLTNDHPIVREIYQIAQRAADPLQEMCGVVITLPEGGNRVVTVPNRSEEPHTGFRMLGSDLHFALEHWFESAPSELWREVIFWHTHPSGGIGPSRIDMQNKPPSGYNLVVAITADGPIPTLY